MKQVISTLLTGYQTIISPIFHQLIGAKTLCLYSPTCSDYAREMIEKEGIFRGGRKAIVRLLHCHPFAHTYESV